MYAYWILIFDYTLAGILVKQVVFCISIITSNVEDEKCVINNI